jgi:bacterioferritin (cytochrome b1)
MKGNPKVIDYLNKALRHELTAVNQYWLTASADYAAWRAKAG